jgi:hypothetical protein
VSWWWSKLHPREAVQRSLFSKAPTRRPV